ncbi:glycosyltransferase family 4 protein [Thermofilum sp.]|uniref:glycosyltransferase family 4 protein n=1 Tax=Thermofilum sp. TaxID=1961369 RepID=UPI00315F2573
MRIVHTYHSYYPAVGGLEKVVQKLAEEQAKLGHEVHVITSQASAKDSPVEEELNNVYVHRVKAWRLHYPDLTIPRGLNEGLLRGADVVHAHSQNSLFNMIIAKRAKSLGAKVAVHFMAVNAFGDHPSILVRALGPMYGELMVKEALKVADLKLVKSYRDMMILRDEFEVEAGNLHYVPDGVDEELLTMPSLESEFRRRYNVDDDIVLFIGRLHPLKGLEVLLKAVPYVVKEKPRVRFVFIGPGDTKRYIEVANKLGVADRVLFLGFVDEHTKIGAIDSSVCLVLPSICNYVEVYPMVISEAWTRGKPVVASNVGGIPYRVKHMVNGILVPPRDPKALAEAIIKLLEDKMLATKMGLEGKKELETWSKIASTLVNLYKGV